MFYEVRAIPAPYFFIQVSLRFVGSAPLPIISGESALLISVLIAITPGIKPMAAKNGSNVPFANQINI